MLSTAAARRRPSVPGRHVPMVFTLLASLVLGALLSGCDQDYEGDQNDPSATAAIPAAVAAQQRTQPGTLAPVTTSASTDIPVSSPGAYIGRWAATAALCQSGKDGGAWEFTPGHVRTAGETSCDLDTPTISGNTFELNASCKAEGTTTQETWRLVFNGTDTRTAQPTTMNVQRDAHEPVQLVRCPL